MIFTTVHVSFHFTITIASTDMAESRDEPDAKRRKLAASASGSGSKAQSSVSSQQFQAGKCRESDLHQNSVSPKPRLAEFITSDPFRFFIHYHSAP